MRWCVRFFGVRSVEGAVNSQVVPIARFMKIPIGCHLHRFLFIAISRISLPQCIFLDDSLKYTQSWFITAYFRRIIHTS